MVSFDTPSTCQKSNHTLSPPLFQTMQVPTVFSATPSASIEQEEVIVTVAGQGFVNLPTLACRFGLVTTPAQFISSEYVLCRTPAESDPSTVNLEVTLNGLDYSAQGLNFIFLPMASLRRLVPEHGLVNGGIPVVVEGSGFAELRDVRVRVKCRWEMPGSATRDVLETRATIMTDSEMSCISPPAGEPGTAGLYVLADEVSIANQHAALPFVYELPARPLALVPAHGTPAGGTRIKITGEGFVEGRGLSCRFHTLPIGTADVRNTKTGGRIVVDVPAEFVTQQEVRCLSPAMSKVLPEEAEFVGVGHVLVEVSNHGWRVKEVDADRGLSFWYHPAPTVSVLSKMYVFRA